MYLLMHLQWFGQGRVCMCVYHVNYVIPMNIHIAMMAGVRVGWSNTAIFSIMNF